MNDATVQQLAVAIQAHEAAAGATPPPLVAPAGPNFILPYEGDTLDLSSRTRTSLFQKGSEPFATTLTGKVSRPHRSCRNLSVEFPNTWHPLFDYWCSQVTHNLLEDYGNLTNDQVEAACVTQMTGPDIRAKQNAQMMNKCQKNSITDESKALMASPDLDFYEHGPVLFFHIMNQLFSPTFLNA